MFFIKVQILGSLILVRNYYARLINVYPLEISWPQNYVYFLIIHLFFYQIISHFSKLKKFKRKKKKSFPLSIYLKYNWGWVFCIFLHIIHITIGVTKIYIQRNIFKGLSKKVFYFFIFSVYIYIFFIGL